MAYGNLTSHGIMQTDPFAPGYAGPQMGTGTTGYPTGGIRPGPQMGTGTTGYPTGGIRPGPQMGTGTIPGTNMPGALDPDPQMGTGYPTGGIRPDPQMGTGDPPSSGLPPRGDDIVRPPRGDDIVRSDLQPQEPQAPWGSAADRYQIGGSNLWTDIRGAEGAQATGQPTNYPTGGIRSGPAYPTGGIRSGPQMGNAAFAPGARV